MLERISNSTRGLNYYTGLLTQSRSWLKGAEIFTDWEVFIRQDSWDSFWRVELWDRTFASQHQIIMSVKRLFKASIRAEGTQTLSPRLNRPHNARSRNYKSFFKIRGDSFFMLQVTCYLPSRGLLMIINSYQDKKLFSVRWSPTIASDSVVF